MRRSRFSSDARRSAALAAAAVVVFVGAMVVATRPALASGPGDGFAQPQAQSSTENFAQYAQQDYYKLHYDFGQVFQDMGGSSNPFQIFSNAGPAFGAGIVAAVNYSLESLADTEVSILHLLGYLTIGLFQLAFSPSGLGASIIGLFGASHGGGGSLLDNFATSLKNSVYGPYFLAIPVFVAIWLTWMIFVSRRLLRGVQGVLWAALVLALSTPLLLHPSEYMNDGAGFAFELSNAVMSGFAQYDSRVNAPQSNELGAMSERLWEMWVYDPWTEMEFGRVDPRVNGRQLGIELLEKQKQGPSQQTQFDSDMASLPPDMKDVQHWYDGDNVGGRLAYGAVILVVTLFNVLLIAAIAFAMILAQLMVVLLFMAIPLVALLGPIPGFGQSIVVRWGETLVGAFAMQVIATLFMTILLAVQAALTAVSAQVGWLVLALLQLTTAFLFWHLRKTFFRAGKRVVQPNTLGGTPAARVERSRLAEAAHGSGNAAVREVPRPVVSAPMRRQASQVSARSAGASAKGAADAAPALEQASTASTASRAAGSASSASTAASAAGAAGTAAGSLAAVALIKSAQFGIRKHDQARRWVQAKGGQIFDGQAAHPGPSTMRSRPYNWRPVRSRSRVAPLMSEERNDAQEPSNGPDSQPDPHEDHSLRRIGTSPPWPEYGPPTREDR